MSESERPASLTPLARLGFSRLTDAEALLGELSELTDAPRDALLDGAADAADPDEALNALARLARRDAASVRRASERQGAWRALWALLGASTGFGEFFFRHPAELDQLEGAGERLPTPGELRSELLASVDAVDGFAADAGESAWVALRGRYRRLVARIGA